MNQFWHYIIGILIYYEGIWQMLIKDNLIWHKIYKLKVKSD